MKVNRLLIIVLVEKMPLTITDILEQYSAPGALDSVSQQSLEDLSSSLWKSLRGYPSQISLQGE